MLNKKRLLVMASILAGLLIAAGAVAYYLNSRNKDSESDVVSQELTAPITDYIVDGVEQIVNSDKSKLEKLMELDKAAALKISVQRYGQALDYKLAAYDLIADYDQYRDRYLYDIVILARRTDDKGTEDKYSELLGDQKLREFDTPKNDESERDE